MVAVVKITPFRCLTAPILAIVVSLVMRVVAAPLPAYAATAVTGNTKWAIVLCKFSDVDAEPQPPEFFQDFFTETGIGQGGLFDYWRDMSFGAIDLTGSQVRGWYTISLSRDKAIGWTQWHLYSSHLPFVPIERFDLIKACIDAGDQDFYYPDYHGIVAILNAPPDSGSVGSGDMALNLDGRTKTYGLVKLDPLAWNVSFAAHEMGHGYGLDHSFDSWSATSCAPWGKAGEYCDGWDIMSSLSFGGMHPEIKGQGVRFGPSGPGLNAAYRSMLGWIPSGRVWSYIPYTYTRLVPLAGLQTPAGSGFLLAKVWPGLGNDYYAVEFTRRLSWDRNILRDAVLVRQVHNSRTYLVKGNTGRADLVPGDYFASAADNIMIGVLDIDLANSVAVVKIGPYPSGTTSTLAAVTPPANTDGWSNADTQVTLTSTTSIRGVQSITYSASGAQRIAASTTSASSASFTISQEGETTVVYSATGNDGYPEFPRKLTLKLDKTPPTSFASVTKQSPGVFTVVLSARDNAGGSGLRHLAYEAFGAHSINRTLVPEGAATITISAAGQTDLDFWAEDQASNWETIHTLTFKPIAQLTPANLTFSSPVGIASPPQSVSLKNVGQTTLTIEQISTSSYDPFSARTNPNKPCGTSLAPDAECLIDVVFVPSTSNTYSGTLNITTNTSPSPTVTLTGTGTVPAVKFTPHTLSFQPTLLRDTSQPQTATVENTGQAPLVISAASTGVGTDFLISQDNCDPKPKTLQPGETCQIHVAFRPRGHGARTGGLTLTDNAPGGQHTLSLDGVGVAVPAMSFSQTSLAFGSQPVNTTGAPLTVVLTNVGTANLRLFGVALGGVNASDFSIVGGTCKPGPAAPAVVVEAERTCDVVVRFTPTAEASRSADLLFATNVPSSSQQSVPLSGIGTKALAITLSPTSLVFGSWPVSSVTPSLPQLVTLTNNGSTPLSVHSVRKAGVDPNDFVIVKGSDTCRGATVAVGGTCSVKVVFAPRAVGGRSAELVLVDGFGSTYTVVMAGTGTGPVASFDPPSVSFGALPVGAFSRVQEVILRNVGNAVLVVSSVSVTGDFQHGTWCGSVTPGGSCTIRVVFRPSAAGPRSGQVIVSSNAAGSPHTVTLDGTGQAAGVTLSPPASLAFAGRLDDHQRPAAGHTDQQRRPAELRIDGITASGDF